MPRGGTYLTRNWLQLVQWHGRPDKLGPNPHWCETAR
jgi:hypothetical protein